MEDDEIVVPINNELERKIAEAFDVFDHAGSKTVDVREIGTIVRALGCCPSEAEVQEMIVAMEDPAQPGSIHLVKFLPYISQILTEHKYVILHAGNENGFIQGAELIFSTKNKSSDYHGEMNSDNFLHWFEKKLIPNLEEPSIIVMDNASYHSVTKDKVPTTTWKKADIQAWLTSKQITFDPHLLKSELLQKVTQYQPASPEELLEAFHILDNEGRGFLTRDCITTLMTQDGEPFNQDEIDEMLEIAIDPHTDTVPYEYYINQLMYEPAEEDNMYLLADAIEAEKPPPPPPPKRFSEMMTDMSSVV